MMVVREVEGRGKGLVATRKITAGTVIFSEDPLVVIKKATAEVGEEYKKLEVKNLKLKEDYMALFDPVGLELNEEWRKKWHIHDKEDPEVVKFWRIFCVNSVNIGLVRTDVGRNSDDLSGIYKQFSRINHSCSSNVTQDWKEENPLKIEVRAACTIRKGEELTLNYLGLLRTYKERKEQLKRKWFFHCNCKVCSLSEEEREKNDLTREMITFHMELSSSVQGLATMSNVSSVLEEYLHVLLACYSIEQEAKDVLPVVLCICHKLYQATKAMQQTWECPSMIQEELKERLGQNFMEVLQLEAERMAVVLGSGMGRVVKDIEQGARRVQ